ncbi:hypothetical protein K0U91_11825 [Chryseobacterium chendengshani]|uniref:hypothetical protein n=1 Tax=Chryseobacterium sp. LJ668 TaxID=2864040 RepID=UPI001C6895E1|nr:hypothetical protein [Chryseobacterium sp. LJ668]MBW8523460.1 hypothetical protein [Chryseobacterium sp. LJ668]QYK15746.1 hypothetical protein K0U91_11825 [Chryseobacterium sp. LJ668]
MERKILKGEVIFQTVVSLLFFLPVAINYYQKAQGSDFFIALFYVGVSNLVGFLLRVSLSKSRFHRYYFYGVILFFIALYFSAVLMSDSRIDFVVNFMGIGGVLFNIYYLMYGFYNVRTMQQSKAGK